MLCSFNEGISSEAQGSPLVGLLARRRSPDLPSLPITFSPSPNSRLGVVVTYISRARLKPRPRKGAPA